MSHTVIPIPTAHKSSVACVPNIQRISLPISHNPGGRYPVNPVGGSLPRPDHSGVVYANRLIIFDDAASSFGHLPFQGIAHQALCGRTLPDVAPKILFALG